MTDTITISRYEGGQIQKISADLAHLEGITPEAEDLAALLVRD
jgi:NaMN:DMB phosphoribosyltransferase